MGVRASSRGKQTIDGLTKSIRPCALWLDHESAETTQIYLHADMRLKERALGHADLSGVAPSGAVRRTVCSRSLRASALAEDDNATGEAAVVSQSHRPARLGMIRTSAQWRRRLREPRRSFALEGMLTVCESLRA